MKQSRLTSFTTVAILFLFAAIPANILAAPVNTFGDLKVNGLLDTTGGIKFPDGSTLNTSSINGMLFNVGLVVDNSSSNTGTINYGALKFGSDLGGVGIGSQQTLGNNKYGLDFYTNGISHLSILNNGYVGIGTRSPDSAFMVTTASSSPVRIGDTGCTSPSVGFAGIGLFGAMSGCSNYAIMGEYSATQNLYINRPAGGDINFRMNNGQQMVLDHFGGLHLNANDSNDGVFNHSSTAGAGLAFGAGSGEGIASKRTAGGNQWGLDFYTSGTPRLSLTYGGNVGIGTMTPGSPLTVAGTIESTSGGVKFPDGTIQTTALRVDTSGTNPSMIGGYRFNSVITDTYGGSTIAGGGSSDHNCGNWVKNQPCKNQTTGRYGTVGGGLGNSAAYLGTVAGGNSNSVGPASSIGGGSGNTTNSASYATVGGGELNSAGGTFSTVGGGELNIAGGIGSTVPGGASNSAVGDLSFAAGAGAIAAYHGMFVWADDSGVSFDIAALKGGGASNSNSFNVRATGGVYLVTGIDGTSGNPTWACGTSNGNGWTCTSDRNVKRNLRLIDAQDMLAKVSNLPVYHWQPSSGPNIDLKHIGPMAQDFYAAFGLGDSDKSIGILDAAGVALAAIQALKTENDALRAENEAVKARLDRIEQILSLIKPLTNI